MNYEIVETTSEGIVFIGHADGLSEKHLASAINYHYGGPRSITNRVSDMEWEDTNGTSEYEAFEYLTDRWNCVEKIISTTDDTDGMDCEEASAIFNHEDSEPFDLPNWNNNVIQSVAKMNWSLLKIFNPNFVLATDGEDDYLVSLNTESQEIMALEL